jgi:hypothetical protein
MAYMLSPMGCKEMRLGFVVGNIPDFGKSNVPAD